MTDWRPAAKSDALILRARLYALVRAFFADRNVLEVETPILSHAGNTDRNIQSFSTRFAGRSDAWLRTSPEFALKRLLAAGVGDCYELGRVFRDGEAGRRHNPEFTMLEWYRVGWDHRALIDEVAGLLQAALALVDRRVAVEKLSYRELFVARAGVDPFEATTAQLHDALADFGVCTDGLSRDDWLNLILTQRIEPALDPDTLTFVYDFPPSQAALARIRYESRPAVAERFEAYLGSIELANGYHELTDAAEQQQRFLADQLARAERGDRVPPLDTRLIDALAHGLPACAGVALGVERLLMALLRTREIADVLAFPFDRA
jgi:lysyl-tRNA synthetase class 2